MLILCSNGLSSPELLSQVQEAVQNAKSATLVVTADNIYKEKNYHVPRCMEELASLGLSVDFFDLDTDDAKLLLNYDVVEFIGGNPFYLLHSIRCHKAVPVLREIAEKNVLIGWSAAAFVFRPSLELVNQYSPEMNSVGLTDLSGLSLTSVEVLPHYHRFLRKFPNFEELCRQYEAAHNVNVIRLNDGDGILIDDNLRVIHQKLGKNI